MKKLIRLVLVGAVALCCGSTTVSAQKFGYINYQEIMAAMPDLTEVNSKLQQLSEEYSSQLELVTVEFNNKAQDFQKNQATYTDSMRQLKEKELQDLQLRYEQIQRTGQQDIQETQGKLMLPVMEKIDAAIAKVGKTQGFLIIFDESAGPMAYFDEVNLTNVMSAVRSELGL